MNYKEILDYPMQQNDADAKTVGDYLIRLLSAVWNKNESFSGKRPFGNSGWQNELYLPLVKGGFVKGSLFDEYLDDYDQEAADDLVNDLINFLYKVN